MSDRGGRPRDREREKERERDPRERDRDRDRRRKIDDRDRTRKSRSPDYGRSRHARSRTRSPDQRRRRSRSRSYSPNRSRSRSAERSRRHHHRSGRRSPSQEHRRRPDRRRSDEYEHEDEDRKSAATDFIDGIAKEQQQKKGASENKKAVSGNGDDGGGEAVQDDDELEMMKKFGIPTGFDTTKGKPVPGADVSGVRAVTKRQPRQYMNRRGGFNRPLPAETNRALNEEEEFLEPPVWIGNCKVLYGAENGLEDKVDMLEQIESSDTDGEELDYDEVDSCTQRHGGKVLVNVDSFGAAGDGISDDTQAFIDTWKQACSIRRSVFLVPEGGRYLVNATRFQGPCGKSLTIQIDGTIVAPDEPKNWDPKLSRIWLNFHNLTGVSFRGKGVIDGSGSKWWAASCKKNKSNPCKGAPSALTISSSSAVKVKGLTIQNSQQMHFVISHSNTVRVSNVQVTAPEDSPNTDGIHISESDDVVLQNCKIGTGDDCVSIVNASSNIKMKKIYCGPGHGISIGSLGKDNSTAVVKNIVLSNAFIRDTTNGVRIKTWQGGSGYVKAVLFENVRMENVSNPIIIDQFYCDSPKTCLNQTSAVEVSQVMYRNIRGTSNSKQAMKFACSDTVPCKNIILDDVFLEKEDDTAEVYCNSAMGIGYGVIHPSADCLTSIDKDFTPQEKFIHTEL